MFAEVIIPKEVAMAPRTLGRHLQDEIREKILNDVEGTCSPTFGFVLKVLALTKIGLGVVKEASAYVIFPVEFKALVYRPFCGEIVDAKILTIKDNLVLATVGPFRINIGKTKFPPHISISPDHKIIMQGSPDPIEKDAIIRVRIEKLSFRLGVFSGMGTIDHERLGPQIAD
eukprot:TRINITY_DN3485_c0_g1_i4.p1 TRINITY_DN3485_c0_g1~~TRINITY_DN3485_c0_g1_i4.p1  ORF type:complete len:172 (-),score=32.68 TRINITY_DN3485_c0_g1_i4:197-712(-)